MTTIQINLPDQLAREAESAGLLSRAAIERWLREQLKRRRTDELFEAMDRMAEVDKPAPMSPEEIAAEVAALRTAKRSGKFG